VKNASGDSQTITAKYLVGCDGAKSAVRHALDFTFEGNTIDALFYVADVEMEFSESHDAIYVTFGADSFVAFFPMQGENKWRIIGNLPEEMKRDENEIDYGEIENKIRSETQLPLHIKGVKWFSVYRVHSRRVDKFRDGRCFLAGDAAHIHTPAGGQGMNTGIQDAYNLAWKMACVLRGDAAEQILDTYNEERLPNAERLLGTTDRMFNLAAGSDWLFGLIRTTVFPPLAKYILSFDVVKERFFPLISQIGINYRDGSLSEHAGDREFAVKAGDRLPYFLVDGKSIYDKLREPKFHLLTFSDGTSDDHTMTGEVESANAHLVDHHVVPLYPQVTELFGTDQPFHVLLRPDNYIGFISPETSLSRLKIYLKEVIGHS
nr:FAD-dependent monooxygenase [Pyrinomonadaceae bacterium]